MPRLLLISGNGRDSGKTTLACRLISQFCKQFPIIAVKISPHHYTGRQGLFMSEEDGKAGNKDSSRMLQAGALKSYFVEAMDNELSGIIPELERICNSDQYIICESGGLRKYVNPGVFIIVNRAGKNELKPATMELMNRAHHWLTFDGENFHPETSFDIDKGRWKIKQSYDI